MSMKGVKSIGERIATGGKSRATPTIDSAAIRELADLLAETGLTEIEIEQGGLRLRVARQVGGTIVAASPGAAPVAVMPSAAAAADKPAAPKGPQPGAVPSPMVGTVYVAPEPGKPPFVKVGDKVSEGDTLLIVEAMKTMNPILAPRSGTVTEIAIHDAEPVEFGQTLLVIS
jgi:acetyl-CoA carboxylase biotin carboxyl carrier protein